MIASISVANNQNYLMKSYYHGDLEKPGLWIGSGAKTLGLKGEVKETEMGNLWDGYSPDGERKLVQNAGSSDRKKGDDITYSAPKSVSLAWAVADDDLKPELEAAQHRAVLDANQYLEENAAYTRRGKGGATQEKVGLVTAAFQHGTSREGDPQLHTHTLNLNIGTRDDGSTGSLDSQHLYDRKMAAGAVYRMRLATEVERLGFTTSRDEKGFFEVEGIPEEATKAFSTRSSQVTAHLKDRGLDDTPENRERAALITRPVKGKVNEEELRTRWQEKADAFGVTAESIRELQQRKVEQSEVERQQSQKLVIDSALEKCTRRNSVFKEHELDRAIADSSLGRGMTYDDMKGIKDGVLQSRKAVEVNGDKRNRCFTTLSASDEVANATQDKINEVAPHEKRRQQREERKKHRTEVQAQFDHRSAETGALDNRFSLSANQKDLVKREERPLNDGYVSQ
ncbi:MAG: relaxase domain-containing protein [Leptolyngbya sp. SIO4C1]|nr:relaxase domain-containing protein [Leptolyngbya sp. SIO4C1]